MLFALACTHPPVARPDRVWGSELERHYAGSRVDVLPTDDAPILVSAPYRYDAYGDNPDGAGRVFRLSPHAASGLLSSAADTVWVSPRALSIWGDAFFAGDLDLDGVDDIIVVGSRSTWSDGVLATWYSATDRGRLTTDDARGAVHLGAVPNAGLSLHAIGDVDGDGHVDLALQDGTGAGSAVWFGPFSAAEPRTPDDAAWVTGRSYRNDLGVAAVDLGGDGVRELLVAGNEPDGLHVLDPRSRDLDVSDTPYLRMMASALHVRGDLDDDGLPDVVFGGVFTGLPDDPEPWWRLDEPFGEVATDDFDGDGSDDLVVVIGSQRNRHRAYLFRGPLPRGIATPADADLVIEAHDGPDGWPGLTFAAGDVDGDGRDDLVVGEPGDEESFAGGSVSLYLGRSLFP